MCPLPIDLTGRTFGRWTVIKPEGPGSRAHKRRWLCRCSCGRERMMRPDNLVNGTSQSCGCRQRLESFLARLTECRRGEDECWIWPGAPDIGGYGRVMVNGKAGQAHRQVYEHLAGPIPEGLTLDHLCRNRRCVNPSHLEPTTGRENTLRGEGPGAVNARRTHCVNGHAFDEQNTYTTKEGHRGCRACGREWWRRNYKPSPQFRKPP